jgi:hypothetical protein
VSGSAGTKVTIHGANLGFVTAVYFGTVKATSFSNLPALLDSGSTSTVMARAPGGTVGKKVEVRVVTLESEATGFGKSRADSKATFTYTKNR